MIDHFLMWRDLLYPLGLIASMGFMLRFALQWLYSEKLRRSVVPSSFWYLSLVSNLAMVLHSIIQIQYFVCVIQATNAVISWRNLNLMREKAEQCSLKTVLWLMASSVVMSTLIFFAQSAFLFDGQMGWMRSPTFFSSPVEVESFPFLWHLFGLMGLSLFASRFWVQWWLAEKYHYSSLSPSFWWLSLTGAICSVVYFLSLRDLVNMIGPALGMIPYIRNLVLLKKTTGVVQNEG